MYIYTDSYITEDCAKVNYGGCGGMPLPLLLITDNWIGNWYQSLLAIISSIGISYF